MKIVPKPVAGVNVDLTWHRPRVKDGIRIVYRAFLRINAGALVKATDKVRNTSRASGSTSLAWAAVCSDALVCA